MVCELCIGMLCSMLHRKMMMSLMHAGLQKGE